ncbi:MAG: hypothetical protein HRU28_11975 [Rhizobiales bacterium]|nr:hypothetical protein [Hyphomicrobiales bacterium]
MIELLFKKKYSKVGFLISLLIFCIGITLLSSQFVGESIMNYLIGGVFWVTGRYFYNKIDKLINPEQSDQ